MSTENLLQIEQNIEDDVPSSPSPRKRKKFQKEPSVSSPVSPAFKTDDERKARKGLISLNNIHILKTPSDLGEWKTDLFTFL